MITIRNYQENDAPCVGILIADTYRDFNLTFLPPDEIYKFLGPFQYARSTDPVHQKSIADTISSEMLFVAENDVEIVGVLRGRKERLASLFVRADHHRQGVGRRLVERFEQQSRDLGVRLIRVAATEFAIPFYSAMGYKRSTGLRYGRSFDGRGLPMQPMKKVF